MSISTREINSEYFAEISKYYASSKITSKEINDVFVDVLKGSEKYDLKITDENYDEIVNQYTALKQENKIDARDIVILDGLMKDISDHYARLGKLSLEKKQQKEKEALKGKHEKQNIAFDRKWGFSLESTETSSGHIDATYIDELLQDENLYAKSKQQLKNIKNLFLNNPNSKLNKDRLTVKNGFVVIDGFGLPDKVTEQTYADMSVENSDKLYPDYTIALLNFTAELTCKTFDRGTLNNKNLTDRSLSYEEMLKILETDNNNAILQSLGTLMGKVNKYQYIPMGIDKNGYVIYAGLRPVNILFGYDSSRSDFLNCLVPSHIGG